MKKLIFVSLLFLAVHALSAQNPVKWAKLKSTTFNVDSQDSTQNLSGQQHYTLQLALSDTAQVKSFRVNGQNASRQPTMNNATYDLKDQRIYRSTKNNDFIVYIDLGSRPAGNIKDGEVEILDKRGNALSTTPKSFSAP